MPIYVYEIINPDGTSGETFEVIQRMNEDQLQVHPDNGEIDRRQ
jgi:predicted nucleic acid-binding Zn ribbon protein